MTILRRAMLMENTYRLNMYVAESDVEILDLRRAELGMSRSEFVR